MKYLIAGLGNIGAEYENTRHNIGFKVLDELADIQGVSFDVERLAFYANFKHKGRSFHMIKPTTYMNLSGKSVKYWLTQLKIPQENLLVVLDDLALPFGTMRLKGKGSDGGHNGLKDIDRSLGNNKYARYRFGIGDAFSKGRQVNYVLGEWTNEEEKDLPSHIKTSTDAITSFATIGLARTMNQFN